MRKYLALYLAIGAILGGTAKANAEQLKVTVPFEFKVNGTTLPAATYIIRDVLPNNKAGIAFLGQNTGALAVANQVDTSVTGSKLVFHKIGDEYFLSEVVSLEGTLHFAPSKAERKLADAANHQSVTTIFGN
jgi:uncharacterized protein involved in outer membrane biogenesis